MQRVIFSSVNQFKIVGWNLHSGFVWPSTIVKARRPRLLNQNPGLMIPGWANDPAWKFLSTNWCEELWHKIVGGTQNLGIGREYISLTISVIKEVDMMWPPKHNCKAHPLSLHPQNSYHDCLWQSCTIQYQHNWLGWGHPSLTGMHSTKLNLVGFQPMKYKSKVPPTYFQCYIGWNQTKFKLVECILVKMGYPQPS
jgi:hypothetical protein